jgi:peptidoglycan-associated lipoprotein
MRQWLFVVPIVMLGAGSTACATKKFVRGEVGQVNTKVESLSKGLEETQERTRQNEQKITEVGQKADAAGRTASEAQQTATAARGEAVKVGEKADARANAIEAANRKLIFEVVLSEDQGQFKFGRTALPDTAKTRLDEMVTQLKADPKNIFIEIEGHTDNVGDKAYNEKLGEARANEVKRYLYEAHQVPLHKINVISYGEEKPVGENRTRQGRAQNRRVVVKVLA